MTDLSPLTLADQADYNAAVTMGHDTQPVLDRAYGRSQTHRPAEPLTFSAEQYQRAIAAVQERKFLVMARVESLRAEIAETQSQRDESAQTIVRDMLTRQIARLNERLEIAEAEVASLDNRAGSYREAVDAMEMRMRMAAE